MVHSRPWNESKTRSFQIKFFASQSGNYSHRFHPVAKSQLLRFQRESRQGFAVMPNGARCGTEALEDVLSRVRLSWNAKMPLRLAVGLYLAIFSCILRVAGLQRAFCLHSGAHAASSTLRYGTRKSLFSPRPDEFATVVLGRGCEPRLGIVALSVCSVQLSLTKSPRDLSSANAHNTVVQQAQMTGQPPRQQLRGITFKTLSSPRSLQSRYSSWLCPDSLSPVVFSPPLLGISFRATLVNISIYEYTNVYERATNDIFI